MADYRVQLSWRTHRKRKRLRARLGADGVLAIMDLWAYAAEAKPDGDLSGMSAQDIADEVDYPGDAAGLVTAMLEVGLLEGDEGGYRLHDWRENQPFVATKHERSEAARHAAEVRWGRDRTQDECGAHTESMQGECDPCAPSVHPSIHPSNHDTLGAKEADAVTAEQAITELSSPPYSWTRPRHTAEKRLVELCPVTRQAFESAIRETVGRASRPGFAYFVEALASEVTPRATKGSQRKSVTEAVDQACAEFVRGET